MAVVNELVTRFSFTGSLKPQADFNAGLGKSLGLLAKFATATALGAAALFTWNTSTLASIDPMIQLHRSTGVAIERLQELNFIASVNGSTAQAMQSSILGLSRVIGDAARWTGPGIEGFQRLGISIRDSNGQLKSADTILDEIGSQFTKLGYNLDQKRSMAQSLGIDPSLIQMMSLTGKQMDSLRARAQRLGVINKSQADDAAAFNDSLTTLRFGMRGISNFIAVGFAPQMKSLTDNFINFLEVNQELIVNGITKLGEIMGGLFGLFDRTKYLVLGLAAAFVVWKVATIGLGTVLAVVFSPIYLITAGIIALILIVDDLVAAFRGGQSVIADFFGEIFGIDLGQILRDIDVIFSPANIAKNFLIAVDWIKTGFGDMADWVVDKFFSIGDKISDMWSGVIDHIKSMAVDMLPDWAISLLKTGANAAGTIIDATKYVAGKGIDLAKVGAQGFQSVTGISGSLPQSQTVAASPDYIPIGSSMQQTNEFNITSTDPQGAARAVSDVLQRQQQEAQAQFKRGGR